ncbi:MAG: class I SAM-dependent methyltransferase [Proteobacteria bacterium]|nr:class I SAM-dependent methyltransferase [Pseudomonadota bacterium]
MKRELEPEGIDDTLEAVIYDDLAKLRVEDTIFSCMALSVLNLGRTKGKILDIGVGPAIIPIKIAEYCPNFHIIGVDISESMLEEGLKNVRQQMKEENIELVLGDGRKIDYPDNYFDIVYSEHTLHHISNPRELLFEANRVVKPDGGILIRDVRRPPTNFIVEMYVAIFGSKYNKEQKQLYRQSLKAGLTLRELQKEGEAAGIQDFYVQKNYITHISLQRFAKPYYLPTCNLKYPQGNDGMEKMIKKHHIISSQLVSQRKRLGSIRQW